MFEYYDTLITPEEVAETENVFSRKKRKKRQKPFFALDKFLTDADNSTGNNKTERNRKKGREPLRQKSILITEEWIDESKQIFQFS